MVDELAEYSPRYPIRDPAVLAALRKVPRHELVPLPLRGEAYANRPLPIGYGQTISQPFIVGYMTQALQLSTSSKVLEVGTGSGYQAAVLAEIAAEVYTIEIVKALGRRAKRDLKRLGYDNVHVRVGDGYRGWPEAAPFDAVIVTCSPDHIPAPLIAQLKIGGLMMIPVGEYPRGQELVLVRKTKTGMRREAVMPVRFVPMTGEAVKP